MVILLKENKIPDSVKYIGIFSNVGGPNISGGLRHLISRNTDPVDNLEKLKADYYRLYANLNDDFVGADSMEALSEYIEKRRTIYG